MANEIEISMKAKLEDISEDVLECDMVGKDTADLELIPE